MNDRRGVGQSQARLVMVGNNQFNAQLAGQGRLVDAADAAIDRDEHLPLVGRQRANRFAVQPVALIDPMGKW